MAALAGATAPILSGQESGLPATEVQGRIIVEPSYPNPLPVEVTLTFTNAAGIALEEVILSETIKTTNFRYIRGGLTGEIRLRNDGRFVLPLARGPAELRLIARVRPSPAATSAGNDRYFIKSIQNGGVDLLQKPLNVAAPATAEILITLAKN
jgi:hypothetical protein